MMRSTVIAFHYNFTKYPSAGERLQCWASPGEGIYRCKRRELDKNYMGIESTLLCRAKFYVCFLLMV